MTRQPGDCAPVRKQVQRQSHETEHREAAGQRLEVVDHDRPYPAWRTFKAASFPCCPAALSASAHCMGSRCHQHWQPRSRYRDVVCISAIRDEVVKRPAPLVDEAHRMGACEDEALQQRNCQRCRPVQCPRVQCAACGQVDGYVQEGAKRRRLFSSSTLQQQLTRVSPSTINLEV